MCCFARKSLKNASPELDRRGPRQMRHTFASHLLQDGAPITYVSRQLGHRDEAITLRVYAHWLPDASREKFVNLLDDAQPSATQAQPDTLSARYQFVFARNAGHCDRSVKQQTLAQALEWIWKD